MIALARRWAGLCCLALMMAAVPAAGCLAHEIRPAYLQIDETAPGRYQLLWRTPVLSGMRLPVELRLPQGARDLAAPAQQILRDSVVERRLVDAAPEGLAGRRIVFDGLEATITDVFVRVRPLDGEASTTLVRPSEPWVEVGVPQGILAAMGRHLKNGIVHILLGIDHLAFVLGLIALVGSGWMLVKTVTAFTIAHSITLALATFGVVQVPVPLLNALIALSILFLGPEMVRRLQGGSSLALERPWLVAFAFGLLHGLGFAGGLGLAGLSAWEIPPALFAFNVGVEIGQLAFVAVILLTLGSLKALAASWPRPARFVPAYVVGSLGAFWSIERMLAVFAGGP